MHQSIKVSLNFVCSQIIGDPVFTETYMVSNYAVKVATVTDVPGDTAESEFVNFATHPPGQWDNRMWNSICLSV